MTNEEIATQLINANGVVEEYSPFFVTLKPTINAILNYNNVTRNYQYWNFIYRKHNFLYSDIYNYF